MPGGFGEGSERDNYGALDQYAPSVANGQISPAQWADYQRKRRRAAIIGMLTTIGGASAAGGLAGAFGGGSGAAASGAGSGAALPAAGYSSPGIFSGVSFGAPAAASAGGGASVAASAGAGAGAGIGKALSGMFKGMTARDLASLGLTGASTIGAAMQKPPDMSANTQTTDPNLQKLIATMQGRLDQSEPLYKSIMAMANGLLPNQYQNGGQGR